MLKSISFSFLNQRFIQVNFVYSLKFENLLPFFWYGCFMNDLFRKDHFII